MRSQWRLIGWTRSTASRLVLVRLLVLMATMVLPAHSYLQDYLDEGVPVPEFLPGAVNITVRQGDSAVLPCSVRHLGTKEIAWRRTEEDVFLTIGAMTWAANDHISMDHSRKADHVTTWNLIISNVRPEDDGVYECQVTSRAGQVRYVQLNVVGPPVSTPDSSQHRAGLLPPDLHMSNVPIRVCGNADITGCLISLTGKRYVDLGERIHFVCNASGGPRIADEIDWFKDGNKIDLSKYRHVVIDKYQSMADRSFISELVIEHSSIPDGGEYICRSSRNDIASMKVTVLNADSSNKRRGAHAGVSPASSPEISLGHKSHSVRPQSPGLLTTSLALLLLLFFHS